MKDYNRREFIKTGLLAVGAFFVSFSPFERLTAKPVLISDDTITNLQLQQKAKAYFYQKAYALAEQCYRQLIVLLPDSIAAYDGLAKTLYAQNKSLAAAEAYRQGWLIQKDNPLFCDRLATAIRRLVSGNRKQERAFCEKMGKSELLEVAAQIYIDAIESTKAKPLSYLALGLLDVQKTLEKCNKVKNFVGASTQSFPVFMQERIIEVTQNKQNEWKSSRRKRKKSEYRVESESVAEKLEIQYKKQLRRTLQFDKERESRIREQSQSSKMLYYPLFAEAIKSNSTLKAEKFQQMIQKSDTKDSNASGQLIHYYRKQKEYKKLVQFQKERHTNNTNFWTTVSFAQALRLQAKKELTPDLYAKALDLYKGLKTTSNLSSREYICVYGGILDCLYCQKKYTEVRTTALQALAPYPLSILHFVLVYIKTWVDEGKLSLAEDAYNVLLTGTETSRISLDPIYQSLKVCHKQLVQPTGKLEEVPGFGVNKEKLFDIYYALANMYKKKKDSIAERNILKVILKIEPDNLYVKKRMG